MFFAWGWAIDIYIILTFFLWIAYIGNECKNISDSILINIIYYQRINPADRTTPIEINSVKLLPFEIVFDITLFEWLARYTHITEHNKSFIVALFHLLEVQHNGIELIGFISFDKV